MKCKRHSHQLVSILFGIGVTLALRKRATSLVKNPPLMRRGCGLHRERISASNTGVV